MPIYKGTEAVNEIYLGAHKVQSVYRGNSLLYTAASPEPTSFAPNPQFTESPNRQSCTVENDGGLTN